MATNKNNQTTEATEEVKTEEVKTEEVKTEAPKDDKVNLFVPKGYANDEPNLLIAVNGVNYVLPKGKTSKVPKFVADEYYRSQKAQEALDKRMDEMLEASK